MLVERSDDSALSGIDAFVFLPDHIYTVPELRQNLYALKPVFRVGDNRLSLVWLSGNDLGIRCVDCDVTKEAIRAQIHLQSGVTIHYIDFP